MKHWMLFLLMILGTARAFSQQDYFIYLQADNHQPFYVRMNTTVYSSTESGYLILSRLSDSTRSFVIGFPANAFPEQYFTTPAQHKDAGYLVKNFGDKGWGLFNLQTMAVIMNSNAAQEKKSPEVSVTKKTDAFSTLLANAVNDTAILYTVSMPLPTPARPVVKARPGNDSIAAAPKADTTTVVKTTAPVIDWAAAASVPTHKQADSTNAVTVVPNAANDVIKDTSVPASAPPVVKKEEPASIHVEKTNTLKVAELLTDTSYIAVYVDGTAEKQDTIRISIPLDKPGILIAEAPRNKRVPEYNMPETTAPKDSTPPATEPAQKKVSLPAVDSSAKDSVRAVPQEKKPVVVQETKPVVQEPAVKPATVKDSLTSAPADTLHTVIAPKSTIPNSDCKNLAWDSDVDKLRVKMLAAKSDDDRIVLAKKVFKLKCFNVKQVRALSELFPTDEGKYKWYDTAYPSVSDGYNYASLGDTIKDPYYQSRFKAMIRR